MFLNGNDGGMIVRGDDWATRLTSGTLPRSGPGRYASDGPNVLFEPVTTADGLAVLIATRHDLGDSKYQSIKTQSAASLEDGSWGSGGGLTWSGYDQWVYFTWSVYQPTHVFAADFDGDGLSDVAAHHLPFSDASSPGNSVRVHRRESPRVFLRDHEDADFVPTAPAGSVLDHRAPVAPVRVLTADFNRKAARTC